MVQHIGRRLTLKQSANDTFIIGGGWPAHPEPPPRRFSTTWESTAGNVGIAMRVVPLLADVRIVRTWSGVMAFTDDLAPIVGESGRVPGFHTLIATTGFTLAPADGPAAGRVDGERPRHDSCRHTPSTAPRRAGAQ